MNEDHMKNAHNALLMKMEAVEQRIEGLCILSTVRPAQLSVCSVNMLVRMRKKVKRMDTKTSMLLLLLHLLHHK